MNRRPPRKIFVSYSRRDTRWLERLHVHLRPLVRNGTIDLWDDTRISPGAKWRSEINDALVSAHAAILLVSADFLSSDFIANHELPLLMETAGLDKARVFPIIVGPCLYHENPTLCRYQAVNSPDRPMSALSKAEAEAHLVKLARAVADLPPRPAPGVAGTVHSSRPHFTQQTTTPRPTVEQLASTLGNEALSLDNLKALIAPVMRDIVDSLRAFPTGGRERAITARYLALLIDRLRIEANELVWGQIVTEYSDCSFLTYHVNLLAEGDELLGLSNWEIDKDWWMAADADSFLQANRHAIAQGASICRIFVCEREDPQLLAVASKHVEAGVDVRIILLSDAPQGTPLLRSQCVLRTAQGATKRGWLTYQVELDKNARPKHNVFNVTPNAIERNERALEDLLRIARHWGTVQCEGAEPDECASLERECRADQLVREGQNDGRRIYVHENAFLGIDWDDLSLTEQMYKTMAAVRATKILHKFTYQGPDAQRVRMSKGLADQLNELVGRRWLGLSTDLLRSIAFTPATTGSGRVITTGLVGTGAVVGGTGCASRRALLPGESVVGTRYDRQYYTFATSHHAARRMYTDNLDFDLLRGYVRRGGDPYRDLTLIEAPECAVASTASSANGAEALSLWTTLVEWFEEEIEDAIASASGGVHDEESRRTLKELVCQCSTTVRQGVLRFGTK